MTVVFRTDSSSTMGMGHVMRCVTLANGFDRAGQNCHFLCRDLAGNRADYVRASGHGVTMLGEGGKTSADSGELFWLPVRQSQDAEESAQAALKLGQIELLIVDHYGLDAEWEAPMGTLVDTVFVIDDLANRPHECDALLDQNLGRKFSDYADLLPERCAMYAGPKYALLRPEFAATRPTALMRRRAFSCVKDVLVSLGGGDHAELVKSIISMIGRLTLTAKPSLTIAGGLPGDAMVEIEQHLAQAGLEGQVIPFTEQMADLMVSADLAIAGGGSASWERCCLGLPTLSLILAENQEAVASELKAIGAVFDSVTPHELKPPLLERFLNLDSASYKAVSDRAAELCDGQGTSRVQEVLGVF